MATNKTNERTPLLWLIVGLTIASAVLFTVAMIIPPTGEVHPSVLKGLAIITANIALVNFAIAALSGRKATFTGGGVSATVSSTRKKKDKS